MDSYEFTLEKRAIFDIFEAQFTYEVPEYQREYSWTKKEVIQFLRDVFKLYDEPDIKQYFLGATVLISNKEDNTKFQIIDGQQRLTTLLIFLNVLKNKYLEIKQEKDAKKIQTPYLQTNDGRFKLKLNKNNKDFFDLYISSPRSEDYQKYVKDKEDSNGLIIKAHDLISLEIEKKFKELRLSEDKRKKYYNQLKEIITKTNSLVKIVAGNEEISGLIFETLNTRGKSLEVFEIIKNHIFWRAKDNKEEIKTLWNDILKDNYKNLSKNFFHSFITNYGLVKKKDLFEEFKKLVNEKDYYNFTMNLKKDIEILDKLKNPKEEGWSNTKILSDLELIKLFRVEQVYFILLASKKTNFHFEKILSMLVKMVFINKFSQHLPFVIRRKAEDISKKILKKEYQQFQEVENDLKEIKMQMDALKQNFFYNDKDETLKKNILIKINMDENIVLDMKKITLEHIHNKNQIDENKERLGETYRYNQIHNLTLLSKKDNRSVADKPFSEKVGFYKNKNNIIMKTNNKLSELFDEHKEFNGELIKEYQDFLWEKISEIFNLS